MYSAQVLTERQKDLLHYCLPGGDMEQITIASELLSLEDSIPSRAVRAY